MLTRAVAEDILNAIFGAFKDRYKRVCNQSDKVMFALYERYGVDWELYEK